jgi:biotin carboxylase
MTRRRAADARRQLEQCEQACSCGLCGGAVLKPISGLASIGVKRVNEYADLVKAYKDISIELESSRVVAGILVTDQNADTNKEVRDSPCHD